jgi:predicted RNase H-like nuclease
MMFVGVDGCKKGWFAIKLTEGEEWASSVFENIDQLWGEFKRAAVILIDIPIGLKEHGPEERECDVEARRFLGKGRASSVFRPPSRKAIYFQKVSSRGDVLKLFKRFGVKSLRAVAQINVAYILLL